MFLEYRDILTPYTIAIGEENTYLLNPHFQFIKNDKINDCELLNTKESSVDPFDYHVSNRGKKTLEKLRKN